MVARCDPPQSPDSTPFGSLLRDFVKGAFVCPYAKIRVSWAVQQVDEDMLSGI
jgi:hypothetical protein